MICWRCGEYGLTKVEMLTEIAKMVGFKSSRTKYSDGNITKDEVAAIYKWIRKEVRNARVKSKSS